MPLHAKYAAIAAILCTIAGIVLATLTYQSWREYRSYSVEAEGVVSQRTETSAIVRLEGAIPGGQGFVEIDYAVLTGRFGEPAVPADDALQPGDKVALLHPPGKPADARLAEGLRPTVPLGLGWAGAALIVCAALLGWLGWHLRRRRRQPEDEPLRAPELTGAGGCC
jgi:hypothetical protein